MNWTTSLQADPPASVPGVGDHARFERGGATYTVTFIDSVDVDRVSVPSDIVTWDLQGRSVTTDQVIHLGTVFNDIGSLTLRNGFVASPVVFVAFDGGDGRLTVESDAILTVNGSLSSIGLPFAVGGAPSLNGGQGRMTVFGTVNVFDTDSFVGSRVFADGNVTVDGGTWSTGNALAFGHNGGTGHLLIEGDGLVTAGDDTAIGESGNAALNETGTGEVNITNGRLSTGGDALLAVPERTFGDVDIVGSNARWVIAGSLTVSGASPANLHVRNESELHVQGANTFISTDPVATAEGLLNVTTFGTLTNDGNLYVGGSNVAAGGPGHLLVQSDGSATIGGLLKVWNTGTLTIDEGSVTTNNLVIENGAIFNFASGELVINAGSLTLPGNLVFGGFDILNRPVFRIQNGSSASATNFFLGELPGTFADFDVNNSALNITKDLVVGGDDVKSRGNGKLSIRTGGGAMAGQLLRVWETGEIAVDSGQLMAAEAMINGGKVSLTGGAATMQIDADGGFAPGLTGIHVGLSPTVSNMRIDNGGSLNASGIDFSVGSDTSSLAMVRVDGAAVTAGAARIGNGGDGTLIVENAAKVHFEGDMIAASGPNSRGTTVVDGNSASLTVDGRATIARQGISLLQISSGGTFHSAGNTLLGSEVGVAGPSMAFVTVGTAGAQWDSDGSIYVGGDESGPQGEGQIIVSDGGTVANDGTMRIWPTGTLTMDGGVLRTRDLLMENATLELLAGTIQVNGGQFRLPSTSLVFGGADPADPVDLEFLNGADAQTTFAWHIGRNADTFGNTKVAGVSNGTRSTLRGTSGGGGADLVVGLFGDGRLDVEDGGLVNFGDDVIIGSRDDAFGLVNVRGVSEGQRATIQITRSGAGAGLAVGGQHDGGTLTGGAGDLNIHNGGLVHAAGDLFIGFRELSSGGVVVGGQEAGFEAELIVGDDAFLGGTNTEATGDAALDIEDGGKVTIGDTLRLWPTGSLTLNGGTLDTGSLIRVAPAPYDFRSGLIRIDGGNLVMGGNTHTYGGPSQASPPSYEFVNGALFEIPSSFTIGSAAGTFAKATVSGVSNGTRSTIRNVNVGTGADIRVGGSGSGVLEVLDGALVDIVDDLVIGRLAGSAGEVTVDGVQDGLRSSVFADGRGVNSSVYVGGDVAQPAYGELTVTNGGLVQSGGDIWVANAVGSFALVRLDSAFGGLPAVLRTQDDFNLGGTDTTAGGDAEILVSEGGQLEVADTLRVWGGGFVDLDGGIIRTGRLILEPGSGFNFLFGRLRINEVVGDLTNFFGTLTLGSFVTAANFSGDYTQDTGGTLEIDINGTTPGSGYDVLNVIGQVNLAGTLHVIVDDGFVPTVGTTFTVLTFDRRTGVFHDVSIEGAVFMDVIYTDSSVQLVVSDSPAVTGDMDGDRVVDNDDYAVFHDCLTAPDAGGTLNSPCTAADMDHDGDVDLVDFGHWEATLTLP